MTQAYNEPSLGFFSSSSASVYGHGSSGTNCVPCSSSSSFALFPDAAVRPRPAPTSGTLTLLARFDRRGNGGRRRRATAAPPKIGGPALPDGAFAPPPPDGAFALPPPDGAFALP